MKCLGVRILLPRLLLKKLEASRVILCKELMIFCVGTLRIKDWLNKSFIRYSVNEMNEEKKISHLIHLLQRAKQKVQLFNLNLMVENFTRELVRTGKLIAMAWSGFVSLTESLLRKIKFASKSTGMISPSSTSRMFGLILVAHRT